MSGWKRLTFASDNYKNNYGELIFVFPENNAMLKPYHMRVSSESSHMLLWFLETPLQFQVLLQGDCSRELIMACGLCTSDLPEVTWHKTAMLGVCRIECHNVIENPIRHAFVFFGRRVREIHIFMANFNR